MSQNELTAQARDALAGDLIARMLNLAVVVRDEGPEAVAEALAAITDPQAALVVAAALIRVDEPVDPWWQNPLPAGGLVGGGTCERCHGPTHRANVQAKYCDPCRLDVRRENWREGKRTRRELQVAS